MNDEKDCASVKVAIGLLVTVVSIMLGWLWFVQQQIMAQSVATSDAVGRIFVIDQKVMAVKEYGSLSAQKALIDVERLERIFFETSATHASKADMERLERRIDRLEPKGK